ncbi:alpha/beta fold hydrolase [Ulvibacterium marinum]|uniref:Alpha/beta hydrolase n=1 Tax=Ulvibacterium marinum TaxID=2419782 RepID=A0A3B0C4R1_9FLAO|nr:alpha/beta hydrolase [Ulvibacterium marinum]RKN81195.1 alpha/beta hydrolase [Ulvibacterium marinum]
MKQPLTDNIRIAFLALTMLFINACSNDHTLSNLDATVFVRHKDADMPAYIKGNGSEKVFLITLHGGPGGAGLGFQGNAFDQIEDKYGVVYFDQRGSGMSQGNYSEDDVTIDLMAEDVLALVKMLKRVYGNDSRFFLLGHSWGGALGPATLLKDQSEFLGWINVDGSHSPKDLYFEYIRNFERVGAAQIELGNSVPFWESVYGELDEVDRNTVSLDDFNRLNSLAFDAEESLIDDNFINDVKVGGIDISDYNVLTFFWNILKIQSILDEDIIGELSFTERLSEITVPSLILWGKYDMVVPEFYAQEAFDNLGSAEKKLVIFERSGHSPMFTESNQFAREVLQFMDQNK